jgi:hypothetical protein
MNQTAVEWFIINLIQVCGAPPEGTWKEVENLLQQAKEMEKEKTTDFANDYADAVMGGCIKSAEQYYNENYEQD